MHNTYQILFIICLGGHSSGRTLYFHSLASITENAVRLSVLDNSTLWESNVESVPRSFVEIGSRGTQSSSEAMDSNGNLFFSLTNPIGIACWDSTARYTKENMRIVAQNDQTLQFGSGVKVIRNRRGKDELWVLSCRFQVCLPLSITLDYSEVHKYLTISFSLTLLAENYGWNN